MRRKYTRNAILILGSLLTMGLICVLVRTGRRAGGQIDLNSAGRKELMTLDGIGEVYSRRIIEGRPYKDKEDLVRLGILPRSTYDRIVDALR